MSIILLRTLTRKSIIGFGDYTDLSVQNLIDTFRTKELLKIYYNFRNIDFNQDLKDELCISGEREINKKEPKEERFDNKSYLFIPWCIKLMLEKKDQIQIEKENMMIWKSKNSNKKNQKVKEYNFERGTYSKGAMKARHQKNK